MAAAAAIAMVIVGVWSGVWLLGPASLPTLPGGDPEFVWSFLEEVSLALFALADTDVIAGTEPQAGLSDALESALDASTEGPWLCDSDAWWVDSECESQPVLLLAGGQ